MKTFTFILLVIIVIISMTTESYSAKDTLPPDPRWIMFCNGTVEGLVEDLPRTYERSKLDSIILKPESYNFDFFYDEFVPGKDFYTNWYAKVIDKRNDSFIKIRFKDVAGNDTTIQFFHYAKKLRLRPNLDFGILNIDDSKEMECWIKCESTVPDTITGIQLKYDNQGFEISGISLPVIIQPGDSIEFKVKFTSAQDGIFIDSIGIRGYYYYEYLACVRAVVGSPRIVVSNTDFGDVPLLQTVHSILKIENFGIIPLSIIGYKGPNNPNNFITDLPDINKNNPLIIEPNQSFSFYVSFWPTEELSFRDSIIFISSKGVINTSDSVAELSGRGIIVEAVENSSIDNEIIFYPNPADGFLSINFNNDARKPDFVRLFDYYGNVVYENKNIVNENLKIKTSELASGMYMLQIGNGRVSTRKLLVLH